MYRVFSQFPIFLSVVIMFSLSLWMTNGSYMSDSELDELFMKYDSSNDPFYLRSCVDSVYCEYCLYCEDTYIPGENFWLKVSCEKHRKKSKL